MPSLFLAKAWLYCQISANIGVIRGAWMSLKDDSKKPALASPALSLPSMLVIRSVMGTKKTVVYVLPVVVMSTIKGMIYGGILA